MSWANSFWISSWCAASFYGLLPLRHAVSGKQTKGISRGSEYTADTRARALTHASCVAHIFSPPHARDTERRYAPPSGRFDRKRRHVPAQKQAWCARTEYARTFAYVLLPPRARHSAGEREREQEELMMEARDHLALFSPLTLAGLLYRKGHKGHRRHTTYRELACWRSPFLLCIHPPISEGLLHWSACECVWRRSCPRTNTHTHKPCVLARFLAEVLNAPPRNFPWNLRAPRSIKYRTLWYQHPYHTAALMLHPSMGVCERHWNSPQRKAAESVLWLALSRAPVAHDGGLKVLRSTTACQTSSKFYDRDSSIFFGRTHTHTHTHMQSHRRWLPVMSSGQQKDPAHTALLPIIIIIICWEGCGTHTDVCVSKHEAQI